MRGARGRGTLEAAAAAVTAVENRARDDMAPHARFRPPGSAVSLVLSFGAGACRAAE
jgi:hypothetical protein